MNSRQSTRIAKMSNKKMAAHKGGGTAPSSPPPNGSPITPAAAVCGYIYAMTGQLAPGCSMQNLIFGPKK